MISITLFPGQHIKPNMMEGDRRKPGLRERTATASRETMVGATGIEPAARTMSKKRGDATSANASFGADDDIRTPASMGACDPSRTWLAVLTVLFGPL
jgi:hypothetical protein